MERESEREREPVNVLQNSASLSPELDGSRELTFIALHRDHYVFTLRQFKMSPTGKSRTSAWLFFRAR